jgi:hypothetical protein
LIAAVERPLIQWGGRGMGLLVPLRGRLCRMKVRRMAVSRPFGEPGALHALSNARSSASYARRRILGDFRKTHPLHRVPLKLAQHPTEQLLKRTERNADGGRSRPAVKVLDERFDVFAPDRVDSGRYPATEVRELFSRLRVGLDGSWCAPAARSDRCQVRNQGPVWVLRLNAEQPLPQRRPLMTPRGSATPLRSVAIRSTSSSGARAICDWGPSGRADTGRPCTRG